jgi:hypothetical protein
MILAAEKIARGYSISIKRAYLIRFLSDSGQVNDALIRAALLIRLPCVC